MDRWKRFSKDRDGKDILIQTFGNILKLDSNELIIWIQYLQQRHPHLRIEVDRSALEQEKLNAIVDEFIEQATLRDADTVTAKVAEQAPLNVQGANVHDKSEDDAEDGQIEYSFVRIDTHADSEEKEFAQRSHLLVNVQQKLYPASQQEENGAGNHQNDRQEGT